VAAYFISVSSIRWGQIDFNSTGRLNTPCHRHAGYPACRTKNHAPIAEHKNRLFLRRAFSGIYFFSSTPALTLSAEKDKALDHTDFNKKDDQGPAWPSAPPACPVHGNNIYTPR
jgi:hypothetical protein